VYDEIIHQMRGSHNVDVIGLDAGEISQQVVLALLGTVIIFFVISPIGGYFLHKFIKSKTPDTDTFALMAGAFIVFIVTSGLTLALILQFTEQTEATFLVALVISGLFGIATTGISAFLVVRLIERGKKKIDPEEQSFSVWAEDKRNKPKNLRYRR
jgi:hypothetical protein